MLFLDDLSDDALKDKIIELQTKMETLALGGDVQVVQGEGRRMELTRSNIGEAQRLLERYHDEWYRRFPDQRTGRAIGVKFCD